MHHLLAKLAAPYMPLAATPHTSQSVARLAPDPEHQTRQPTRSDRRNSAATACGEDARPRLARGAGEAVQWHAAACSQRQGAHLWPPALQAGGLQGEVRPRAANPVLHACPCSLLTQDCSSELGGVPGGGWLAIGLVCGFILGALASFCYARVRPGVGPEDACAHATPCLGLRTPAPFRNACGQSRDDLALPLALIPPSGLVRHAACHKGGGAAAAGPRFQLRWHGCGLPTWRWCRSRSRLPRGKGKLWARSQCAKRRQPRVLLALGLDRCRQIRPERRRRRRRPHACV